MLLQTAHIALRWSASRRYAAAINIWSLRDQAYSSHIHYYPTTRTAASLAGFRAFYEMGSESIDINFISIKPFA